ncbi:uncharacterized protein N7515_004624 [Penicillium bovifimosum]|uniref:CCHC-type domain-containing protein n=1 Tax=Penicillium bovifimosum TaxID=126998 RepID=A0A9W9L3N2_9EURO|nr:uncharacterized protein N7515_004624 [Penicillium bovifimosum]KAJ5135346.1 hypothetical protein N7515_004624 [Penicillium bovifimosum]
MAHLEAGKKRSKPQGVTNPDDELRPQGVTNSPDEPEAPVNPPTTPDPPYDDGDDTGGEVGPRIAFDGTRLISCQLDPPTVTKKLLKADLNDRYDRLITVYKELEEKFHELEGLNSELEDKVRDQSEIINERDEAMARYHRAAEQRNKARTALETSQAAEAEAVSRAAAATAERDAAVTKQTEMALKFFDLQNSTPVVEATQSKKTTRLPDAPMLSDGIDVRESWKTGIKRRLAGNPDHFPDANARIQYVQSRAEGQAFRHMAPRLDEDSSDPYKDYEDILAHMKTVFSNPNHVAEARAKYQRLTMKPRYQFTTFLADFMELANEARIHEEDRKQDLYEKLPPILRNQMLGDFCEDEVSFETFKARCIRRAHAISQGQLNKAGTGKGRSYAGRATASTSSPGAASSLSNSKVKTENSATPTHVPLSTTERALLMKEGRCFDCREPGHMTRDCPKKSSSKTTAAPAVAAAQSAIDLTALEDPAVDNSGKARA